MRDYQAYAVQFEAQQIDPREFSHVDHVGVAWAILGKYDFLEACNVYSRTIHALATSVGATTKFNVTITFAFLSIVAEKMNDDTGEDFAGFLDRNPDLLDRGLLSRWYPGEILKSEAARTRFLMPKVA